MCKVAQNRAASKHGRKFDSLVSVAAPTRRSFRSCVWKETHKHKMFSLSFQETLVGRLKQQWAPHRNPHKNTSCQKNFFMERNVLNCQQKAYNLGVSSSLIGSMFIRENLFIQLYNSITKLMREIKITMHECHSTLNCQCQIFTDHLLSWIKGHNVCF